MGSFSLRALLIGAVLLVAVTAGAYILPASSIFRRMADVRDELALTGLRVDGTVVFSGETARLAAQALKAPFGESQPQIPAEATLFVRVPGKCRFDATTPEGGKLTALSVATGKKRTDVGTELAALNIALDQACPLLAFKSGSGMLEKFLNGLKLSDRGTSLARFSGQVAYVIGDPAANGTKPQLWVYKETFLPARVRVPDGQGSEWDVRLMDYASPITGQWFPRIIEVRHGNEVALKYTALKSDPHARVDDRMF